jgi:hypothetical protein
MKHYHFDNGRFADNAYLDHVTKSGQTTSYCGVNAPFQNGIAEKSSYCMPKLAGQRQLS